MISCLRAADLGPARLRSAYLLARSGLLDGGHGTRARMELAAQTLMKLGERDFYLSRIAVAPAAHRTGVADRLMRHCLDRARETASTRLCLEVSSGNIRAIRFYKRWGFEALATRGVEHEDGRKLEYVHMAKPVA